MKDEHRRHLLIAEICMDLAVPFFWQSHGALFVNGKGARDVVRVLMERGYRLLGVEGFEIPMAIHPRIDLLYSSSNAYPNALAAVSDWEEEVWVDISIDDDSLG